MRPGLLWELILLDREVDIMDQVTLARNPSGLEQISSSEVPPRRSSSTPLRAKGGPWRKSWRSFGPEACGCRGEDIPSTTRQARRMAAEQTSPASANWPRCPTRIHRRTSLRHRQHMWRLSVLFGRRRLLSLRRGYTTLPIRPSRWGRYGCGEQLQSL